MQKVILLLVFFGVNVPIFSMDDPAREEYELVSNDVETGGNQKKLIKRSYRDSGRCHPDVGKLVGAAFCGASWTTVAAVGLVLFGWPSSCPEAPAPAALAQCNIAPVYRFDAHCLPNQPSHDWTVIRSQLEAMQQYSNTSCVPGCTYHLYNERGWGPVVPIGNASEDECVLCDEVDTR